MDLLGLPPPGVPRLDDAPSLADLVDAAATPSTAPAACGSTITQPTAPTPTPVRQAVYLRDGTPSRPSATQNPTALPAPDLLDRDFTATGPNQKWVADVTYVPTVQGWLYLATVLDVFSRRIIGWSMDSHRKTQLVCDAVTMAVANRGGEVAGVIHHSDRGGEYTSRDLELELRRAGALASMGSVADCYDNSMAESFFATLETELFWAQPLRRFTSHREAKMAIFDYIEVFYNRQRRHLDRQHRARHLRTAPWPRRGNAGSMSRIKPVSTEPGQLQEDGRCATVVACLGVIETATRGWRGCRSGRTGRRGAARGASRRLCTIRALARSEIGNHRTATSTPPQEDSWRSPSAPSVNATPNRST